MNKIDYIFGTDEDRFAAGSDNWLDYIDHSKGLPTLVEILDDSSRAKLPESFFKQRAVAIMCNHYFCSSTAVAIFCYILRLRVEMQIYAIRLINYDPKKHRALVVVPGYSKWLIDHKEILLKLAN
jgi:hypothetical protein